MFNSKGQLSTKIPIVKDVHGEVSSFPPDVCAFNIMNGSSGRYTIPNHGNNEICSNAELFN